MTDTAVETEATSAPTTLNEKDKAFVREMLANETLSRSAFLTKMFDSRRDINQECGYAATISTEQYKTMYDREGVAMRVVSIFPEESWAEDPEIVETDDPTETPFEKALTDLDDSAHLFSTMAKADEISGIGRFGILLLGFDDGKKTSDELEGVVGIEGGQAGSATHKLLYIRAFGESVVTIKSTETDPTNERFGQPNAYDIRLDSGSSASGATTASSKETSKTVTAHWTRVIHVADNRKSSEVYGVPRMQDVYNRLYDIRKIAGGSAEMFWKGGFPGISFEMDPQARTPTDPEKVALRSEIEDYSNGLQRTLLTQGLTAKSLDPQVADPKSHIDVQLELIAIAKGVPKRIFMGSERAKLASTQDAKAWNRRVSRRQHKYLTPFMLRPTIDRLIAAGALPVPKEYSVVWPALDTLSETEHAEVVAKTVEALAKYVQGNVDAVIPPEEFLSMVLGLETEQIAQIMKAALKREKETEDDDEMRAAEEAARVEAEAEEARVAAGAAAE